MRTNYEDAMFQPEAYGLVLAFMITSMLCWGSWANTRKLTQGYPFSLFYWDYVIGIVAGSLLGHLRSVVSMAAPLLSSKTCEEVTGGMACWHWPAASFST